MTDPDEVQPPLEEQTPPPVAESAPRERYPFWGYLDLSILTLLAFPLLFAAALAVQGLFAALPGRPNKALVAIAVQFLFWALWFAAVHAIIRLKYDRPFWRSLAWLRPPREFSHAAWMGVLTALASAAVLALLHPPEIKAPIEELMQGRLAIALMLIFGVTLAPLCEELAFRGLLLPLLVRSLGAVAGILLAGLAFALLHGAEYAWSWQRLAVILFAGAAFGWLRYRSGSTAAATVMHATYNLTFFLGFLAQKSLRIH